MKKNNISKRIEIIMNVFEDDCEKIYNYYVDKKGYEILLEKYNDVTKELTVILEKKNKEFF